METPIWPTIVAGLLSGLITFVISTYFYLRQERRKEKLALLRDVMANRHGLTSNPDPEAERRIFQALNAAFATFHDCKPVIEAIQNFKRHPTRASDNTTQLIRSMCKDLKIDTTFLEDSFFDEPFVPRARGTGR